MQEPLSISKKEQYMPYFHEKVSTVQQVQTAGHQVRDTYLGHGVQIKGKGGGKGCRLWSSKVALQMYWLYIVLYSIRES
jgi:hypothetical protein